MLQGRAGHSSTLLPDGRVLIAGGYSIGGPQATAELFDPATGRFQKTGSMSVSRYRHAALALPDGRVAILGGYAPDDQASRSVEIYDPQSGTFTVAGELVEGRGNMGVSSLPDGRILLVGGGAPSIEVYDPASGQSTVTDRLPDGRILPVVAPLGDGRILAAGGAQPRPEMPDLPLRTARVIDSATGKVSLTASMMIERAGPAGLSLPDGRVVILGGYLADGTSLGTAEVYVPASAARPNP
jgi:WD40 repeat protein